MFYIKTSPCFISKHPHVVYQNIPMFFLTSSPCTTFDAMHFISLAYTKKAPNRVKYPIRSLYALNICTVISRATLLLWQRWHGLRLVPKAF